MFLHHICLWIVVACFLNCLAFWLIISALLSKIQINHNLYRSRVILYELKVPVLSCMVDTFSWFFNIMSILLDIIPFTSSTCCKTCCVLGWEGDDGCGDRLQC